LRTTTAVVAPGVTASTNVVVRYAASRGSKRVAEA
jgi:hypothetical protein